jgi:uncharacterized protein
MKFFAALIFSFLGLSCYAESGAPASLKIPALTSPVMDTVGVLSQHERAVLEQTLRQANALHRMQMTILILDSLHEMPIEQASIEIVDQWKLGEKGKDNGLLFLLVPAEKKSRIEVGRGLEGDIPDVVAKRILADISRPYFKVGQYGQGIMAATVSLLKIMDPNGQGEARGLPEVEPAPVQRAQKKAIPEWVILVFFLLFIFLRLFFGGGRGGGGFYIGGGGFGGSGGGGGWSGGGGGFSGGGSSDSW